MWVLEIGNWSYYFYIVMMVVLSVTISLFIRKKSQSFSHLFILCLLFSAFLLHFLKLFFEPYSSSFPRSIAKATFENICAASTLLFPWFYLSKSKLLKDYMVVVGMLSIIGAITIPTSIIGDPIFSFDVLRYYYAHLVIFIAPFLMILSKQHQMSYRNVFLIPFVFYGVLLIILFNEIILISIGLVKGDLNSLLNPNIRNTALIFGPLKEMVKIEWLIDCVVPKLFRTIPYGVHAGEKLYWPIIWLVIPAYFIISLFGLFQCFLFKKCLK